VELVFVIFLMGRILRRLVPSGVGVGVALMFMALNPMLLAMAGAIQNDMLSLLLGLAALVLVLERDGPDLSLADGAVIGAVAALGLITKETVWPLIVAVPVYWALRHGVRRTLPAAVTFVAAYVVLVGWWVGRNLDLYHSLTGKLGIAPVFRVHGLSGVWHVFENLLTYLWLPTEYYRSVIRAPLPLRGIVFLVTIAVGVLIVYRLIQLRAVAGKVRGRVRQGDPPTAAWTLVAVTGIVAVVGWVVLFTHVSGVVGRMAYMVWPLWIGMVAVVVGMVTTGRRALPIWVPMLITVVFLVAANGWVLASTFGLHPTPYRIMLS
jgi:hypothetical protein